IKLNWIDPVLGDLEELAIPQDKCETLLENWEAVIEKIAESQLEAVSPEQETIARLAAMSVLEYERCREAEAEKLGCRGSVLDRRVSAERLSSSPANDALQGKRVTLADVEPWPEPVNGADVLDAVAQRVGLYVVMPAGAADVCALWCAHTHCFKSFMHSPR